MSGTSTTETTKSHYEAHSASTYESAFFYEPGTYMTYLVRLVRDRLGLYYPSQQKRRLLDIGGGTGNFTKQLVDGTSGSVQAIVVDPFLEMSSSPLHETTEDDVQFVKDGAESFVSPIKNEWWRRDVHQILMKEVIHHLDEKDRVNIFAGMCQDLQPIEGDDGGGDKDDEQLPSLLIITRPQYDIDYPLWPEARQVWATNQPSLSRIEGELEEAGFRNIRHSVEAYPCSTPLSRWLAMIRSRFWSTFSHFSDEQLNEACETIKRNEVNRIDDKGDIHFEDRLLFITANK